VIQASYAVFGDETAFQVNLCGPDIFSFNLWLVEHFAFECGPSIGV